MPYAAVEGTVLVLDLVGHQRALEDDEDAGLERRDQWFAAVERLADETPGVRVSHVGCGDNCWFWGESEELVREFVAMLASQSPSEFSGAYGAGIIRFRDRALLGRIDGLLVCRVSELAERAADQPWEVLRL